MEKIVYNKLVRDKIPEKILADGKTCILRILPDSEYKASLDKKLTEELNEYLNSGDILELADLQEIILALVKLNGMSEKEFNELRLQKVQTNGAFEKRIFLESVTKND